MASKSEIKLSPDRRNLLLALWLTEGSDFWLHSNGTCSCVPTERETETLKMAYEAIDNFNKEQMFNKNITP